MPSSRSGTSTTVPDKEQWNKLLASEPAQVSFRMPAWEEWDTA
jgi:hypothetical protein